MRTGGRVLCIHSDTTRAKAALFGGTGCCQVVQSDYCSLYYNTKLLLLKVSLIYNILCSVKQYTSTLRSVHVQNYNIAPVLI